MSPHNINLYWQEVLANQESSTEGSENHTGLWHPVQGVVTTISTVRTAVTTIIIMIPYTVDVGVAWIPCFSVPLDYKKKSRSHGIFFTMVTGPPAVKFSIVVTQSWTITGSFGWNHRP